MNIYEHVWKSIKINENKRNQLKSINIYETDVDNNDTDDCSNNICDSEDIEDINDESEHKDTRAS